MSDASGRDYNKHLLSYLHWDYLYTNAHYYSKSDTSDSIHEYIYNLRRLTGCCHDELKKYMFLVFLKTIKNIVRRDHGAMFDEDIYKVDLILKNLCRSELKSLYKLYKIMINNIYYPWYFFRKPLGYFVLKDISGENFYINPVPHFYTTESFRLMLSSVSKIGVTGSADQDVIDLYNNINFDMDIDVHDENFNYKEAVKNAKIEIKIAEIIRSAVNNGVVDSSECFEYNELISKYNKFNFDSSSNFSRAVGFYLWEKIYFSNNKYDEKNVIDWFYRTNIYKKLNANVKDRKKEYLGDKDGKILLKWLRKTDECIYKKNVISFH